MTDKTRRQAILEAAAILFREKGYAATTMRDLAQAIQLQASSLYNHISSKQDILREICFSNAHQFLSGIEQIDATTATAAEKVAALIKLHIDIATHDLTSVTAFNDEWRHLEEPDLSNFRALRKAYEQRFQTILINGVTAGEFREIDVLPTLYTILSAVRWVYDWYQPKRERSPAELTRLITDLVLRGLQA